MLGPVSTCPWALDAFVDLEGEVPRDRGSGELDLEVVHVVAMLVANEQRVAETLRRDQPGPTGLALDEGIGDEGGGVHDRSRDLGRGDPGLRQQLGHSCAHAVEGCSRCGQRLVDDHAAALPVEEDHVGEGAADVDGQSPVRHQAPPSIRSWRGRREHIEDPALVEFLVADEHALAVPDTLGCQVGLVGPDDITALVGLVVGDAEVEGASHDDPELFVVVVFVEERTLGPSVDAPEAELQMIAGDDPAPEAGPIGLDELVIVEEVAVLVGEIHDARLHQGSELLDVGLEVERLDDGLMLGITPELGRHEPHHLELETVRVLAIEALVDAVVRGAGEGSDRLKLVPHGDEISQRGDLPGEVVHAHGRSTGV